MSIRKQKINRWRREFFLTLSFPLFLIVLFVLAILPSSWRLSVSERIASWSPYLNKRAMRTALSNLTFAYGSNKSESELQQMAVDSMKSITRSMIDFFATGFILDKKKFFNIVEVQGEEHLRSAYSRGHGVICMVPHLSCWELSAVTPPMLGYETSAASKPIKGWLYNSLFVWLRRRRGMKNIDRSGSYAKLLNVLGKGECLIVMADQDTRVKGVFIDFFGRKAYTPLGISRMALDTQAAIVPMAMVRKPDGNYRFEIYPELKTIRTGDYQSDCLQNTIIETQMYEEIIRRTPTQWVWMHRRWKTTPESLERFLKQRAERIEREKKR